MKKILLLIVTLLIIGCSGKNNWKTGQVLDDFKRPTGEEYLYSSNSDVIIRVWKNSRIMVTFKEPIGRDETKFRILDDEGKTYNILFDIVSDRDIIIPEINPLKMHIEDNKKLKFSYKNYEGNTTIAELNTAGFTEAFNDFVNKD